MNIPTYQNDNYMTGRPSDDINKSVEILIDEIDKIAEQTASPSNPASNALGLMTVVGKFACILARLSRDAERQQNTMTRLTWAIFFLTLVLLILTIVQVWPMIRPHKQPTLPVTTHSLQADQTPHWTDHPRHRDGSSDKWRDRHHRRPSEDTSRK